MGRAMGEGTAEATLCRRVEYARPSAAEIKTQLARVAEIRAACTTVWAPDTSAGADEWTEDNPSWGQCAVTSLLVQDFCGGDLLRTTIQGISHYFNRLPDGTEIDLTRQQFGANQELDVPAEERERDYVLSYGPTAERYQLLKERVCDEIGVIEIDERQQAVLTAIKAAAEQPVVDLSWVVDGSKLSGSICERVLTTLHKQGLAKSVVAGGNRSWRITPAGDLSLAACR